MAEYYSAELSQKVKRGMNESRQKGNFTGGYIPFGYCVTGDRKTGRKVQINEDQAVIVRKIFEDYAAGRLVTDIIDELHEKGIENRGQPFARNTVYFLLKNEKYAGIFRHGDEVFTNIYPPISPDILSQDKKFSLLMSVVKYSVALTLKFSKSDGKIAVHSITFEYSVTLGSPLVSISNNVHK